MFGWTNFLHLCTLNWKITSLTKTINFVIFKESDHWPLIKFKPIKIQLASIFDRIFFQVVLCLPWGSFDKIINGIWQQLVLFTGPLQLNKGFNVLANSREQKLYLKQINIAPNRFYFKLKFKFWKKNWYNYSEFEFARVAKRKSETIKSTVIPSLICLMDFFHILNYLKVKVICLSRMIDGIHELVVVFIPDDTRILYQTLFWLTFKFTLNNIELRFFTIWKKR